MTQNRVARMEKEVIQWLTSTNQYNDFSRKFKSCQTDKERVASLYDLSITAQVFQVTEKFQPKNIELANRLREEGNRLFKDKSYSQAVKTYTKSIISAPDNSDLLPLVYNNRSCANFYLKNYAMCLQDIELAFSYNYPLATCHKLFIRKGRCMCYLNHQEEAVKALHQSLVVVERSDMSLEDKQRTSAEIQQVLGACSRIKAPPQNLSTASFNSCHKGIPRVSAAPSKEIPALSDDVEIRLDKFGGRGLFATQDIDVGSVVIVEKPFASFVLKEFKHTHCHYCCNRVSLSIPCRQCSGIIFCSLNCRNAAWELFHWAECRVLENIEETQGTLGLLAARMVLTAGLKELKRFDDTSSSPKAEREAGFEDGVYCSEKYGTCYSLVNHVDEREFTDLLNRTVSAIYFLKNFELVGFFSQTDTDDDTMENLKTDSSNDVLNLKHSVGGHILRNMMMLPCNAHEVSEFALNQSDPPMSATLEIGGAVYPVLSLLNHSCDPSVVRHSFGNICVARAIRGIRKGEELTDNYGALYATHDLQARVEKLSQYFFKCSCEACTGNWPQYFEIPNERPIFRCLLCDGQVPIPAGQLTEQARCLNCGNVQDLTLLILQMRGMEGEYKDALTAIVSGSSELEDVRTLLNYLTFVDQNVHRPFRDINDCQEAFKQVLNINANCFPA